MPAPTAGAVDRGDGRQRRAADPQEALVDVRQARPGATTPRWRQVGAGAEALALAGDDDRADRVVGLDGVEGGDDLVDHLGVEGVAAVGVVERDGGDAVGDLGLHEAHARILSASDGRRTCADRDPRSIGAVLRSAESVSRR